MMISLILLVLIIGITFSFIRVYKRVLKKKELQINELLNQVKKLRDQIKNGNKRKDFRLDISGEDCDFQFVELEDPSLQKLKSRKGRGKIKDISVTGMKISCDYDIPLKNNIAIEIEFQLQSEWFSFKALITRKEKHIDNPDVIYGIQFGEMSLNDNKRLIQCLTSMDIERRNRLA